MKKYAKVYRNAAKLIEDEQQGFSCIAIRDAFTGGSPYVYCFDEHPIRRLYVRLYAHDQGELHSKIKFLSGEVKERDLRVMLLCLAAAVAETGDL